MGHQPITKQRSRWQQTQGVMVPGYSSWARGVHDGLLRAILATPASPEGEWHISISFSDHKGQHGRYPTWDEIMHARIQLIPAEVPMHMIIPPLDGDDYVAIHPTTFHLHQFHGWDA